MAQITEEDIARCFELGVKFAKTQMSFEDAVEKAHAYGMNRASASDYIRNVKYMKDGFAYKRTISAPATDYYLAHFEDEFGPTGVDNALRALEGHIEYYEGLQSGTLHKQREILQKYAVKERHAEFDTPDTRAEFDVAVSRSMADDPSVRRARLQASDPVAKEVWTKIKSFVRNPDVAAEALLRASGRCEKCLGAAPFLRRKDGSPFLEVHHQLPLSEGGEDTVENAIALCPNCHREAHHGVDWKSFRK